MAALERTYTIPLRREWLKTMRYRRTKKAVRAIREFLMRHMKVDEMDHIKIGKYLNLELWKHGIKNPPSRVKINAVKDDKGIVTAEIVGAPVEKKPEAPKKGAKPAPKAPAKEEAKPAETKPATKPEVKPAPEKKPEPAKPAETKPATKPEVKPAPEKKPEPAKPAEKPAEAKPAVPAPQPAKPEAGKQ